MTTEHPKKLVVMYAPPAFTGHLVPMVELSKLLVAQGLEITVVISVEAGADQSAVVGMAAAHPAIRFHSLPASTVPSDMPAAAKIYELVRASTPDLRDFLCSVSPAALLIDFLCSSALGVGAELGIPTYFFLTTCVGILAFSLYQPVLHEQTSLSFRDLGGGLVHAPGLPPMPAYDLPDDIQDRHSLRNQLFLDLSHRWYNSQGVIVNSCRSLELRAADAIVAGQCTIPGRRTPPLYCVGPLVRPEEEVGHHECLAWLDGQPKASVVFLCFGSRGRLGAKQIEQVAAGLEASGQRFLWAVRLSVDGDGDGDERLLLEDFLERTKGRGMVVTSWAPQREVLAHGAVGGFVTHCGWNSVLESVMAGVPMLAWPLYAEQRMNKVFLVDEMRLAAVMEGYDRGMVVADEIAAKVTWLIQSDGGRELRLRTQAAKQRAEEALSDHGESTAALMDLAKQWKSTADDSGASSV